MKYLFELSKEHLTLPTSEVLACLKVEEINYNIIESNQDVLVIDTEIDDGKIKKLASRLSMSFYLDEYLFSVSHSLKELKTKAKNTRIKKPGSIAIRYKNRSKNIDSQPIIKSLGEIYTHKRIVALEDPDIEVRVLITDSSLYIGIKKIAIDRRQFEQRKVQNRPFFSPITLHPKIARALVNLSAIQHGKTFLDPFCGTGGILIEAGLIGANVIGSDIEDKMIEGCKRTLDFYRIKNYDLFCSDIGNIGQNIECVDAVATDLPYGKATTTKGEDIKQLYKRAFENVSNILKEDGRAVFGVSNKSVIYCGEEYFSLVEMHELRSHKSLTRYFAVFKK